MTLTVEPGGICDEYQPYNFQVAGHMYSEEKSENKNFLRSKDGTLLKPVQPFHKTRAEWHFYQSVWHGSLPHLISLRPLIPKYFGTTVIQQNDEAIEYLKLEDLLEHYQSPSVMDVKMGRCTWTEASTTAKIQKERQKFPSGETLGFRLLGMKVYNPLSNSYTVRDKYWGRQITHSTIFNAFDEFFSGRSQSDVSVLVRQILVRLHKIEDWFEAQRSLAFLRSSILFVYDGPMMITPVADARMIDFAHVVPTSERDENYLKGLRNFRGFLEAYGHHLNSHS